MEKNERNEEMYSENRMKEKKLKYRSYKEKD